MEYILFSNQSFKYQLGNLIGLTDTGERKLVLNVFDDKHCSLFVYNMYNTSHEIIRGIKQANIICRKDNYMEIQGYGLSSNGIPIDNLKAKIHFENNQIIAVEYIRLDNDFSLLHKKRIEKDSSFFFELFKLDVDERANLLDFVDIIKYFFRDIDNISNYNDGIELSSSCDYLEKIRTNRFVKNNDKLYLQICLINFYLQYKSINVNTNYNYNIERIKMIKLLNQNVTQIIFLIRETILWSKNSQLIPFASDSEHDRRIKIFWLLESYYLFIESNHDYTRYGSFAAFEDLIQHNQSKFHEGFFYPYTTESAKGITKKIFDLMCEVIFENFRD